MNSNSKVTQHYVYKSYLKKTYAKSNETHYNKVIFEYSHQCFYTPFCVYIIGSHDKL